MWWIKPIFHLLLLEKDASHTGKGDKCAKNGPAGDLFAIDEIAEGQ